MTRASADRIALRDEVLRLLRASQGPTAIVVEVCRETCADPTHEPRYGRPRLCPDCAPEPWDADPELYHGQECARCRCPLDPLLRAEREHGAALETMILRARTWVELRASGEATREEIAAAPFFGSALIDPAIPYTTHLRTTPIDRYVVNPISLTAMKQFAQRMLKEALASAAIDIIKRAGA